MTWGIIWTVCPRYSPFLSFSRTFENTLPEVGVLVKILVDKSFVVSEVEVGFRSVFGNVNFPVLNGVHCAGVYVHIGVELLRRDFIPSQFQKSAERRGDYSFSESRNDSARNEYVFSHNASYPYRP